jgi:hypothetical protein
MQVVVAAVEGGVVLRNVDKWERVGVRGIL